MKTNINGTNYIMPKIWNWRSRIFRDTWQEGKEFQNSTGSMRVYKLNNGKTLLYSYNTLIIEVEPDGSATCSGTYSATTRRHISQFFRDFFPKCNYYVAKKAAATGERFSVV